LKSLQFIDGFLIIKLLIYHWILNNYKITGCLKKLEEGILSNHEIQLSKKNILKDDIKINNEYFW
jgi:hypothetical protein